MFDQLAKISLENANRLQIMGTLEGHTAPVLSVDIDPGGQLLASGSMDGTVRIWNLLSWKQVSVLAVHPEQEQIPRVAFSPTHPDYLAAAIDRKPSWETPNVMDYVGNLMKDMFSFSTGRPVWRLWSLEREAVIHTQEMPSTLWGGAGLTYSRDGRWLAAMDGAFNATTEPPYARAAQLTGIRVRDMAFSEDGQLLALVTFYEKMPEAVMYHSVEVYQTAGWTRVAEIKETRHISSFANACFLPKTHDLLVRTSQDSLRGGGSHELHCFKGDSFEDRFHVLSDVACFACCPDASIVAVAQYDGQMVLLDWDRRQPVATVQAYKAARPVKMPRVIWFGAINAMDEAVKSPYRATQSMLFSRDSKLIVSADGDRVIRIWGIPV